MQEHIDTLVGEKTQLTGDLRFRGGLHVDGRVEGSIVAESGDGGLVVISEHGVVKGKIHAPRIVVNGTVEGDLRSSEQIELQENARVNGNIHYQSIVMKLGAEVTGQLMVETDARAVAPVNTSEAAGRQSA